ncbi:hypothetical protein [Butyricimonas sp. Marseille-P3923]|uniref:hypothetical protein n=1 Tax=Butyricimonas sp. Marseille-P3923 TaxID=1987504 RepID=UPI001145CC4D|nr:hypothetical protein [Butyricimonas sp. Marseille-P3923]
MKKIILTLSVCLSCIMIANARWYPHVVDTLPKRVVNGLEVIPVRTTYNNSGEIYWKLRISDFEKCFQRFESKYPGEINYNLNSDEVNKAISDWEDKLWEIYPPEIKALKDFDLKLFVDKDGRVFAVEFSMPDETFQKLEGLPENTLKNFYRNLIREECKAFKEVDFHVLNPNYEFDSQKLLSVWGSSGSGNEYTTIFLNKFSYDVFGTFRPWRLPKDEFRRLLEKEEAKMKSREKEQ